MDSLWPWLLVLAVVALVIAGWRLAARHYQRCPHCRRTVRRARRGWRRCPRCGRQYHRSVVFHR